MKRIIFPFLILLVAASLSACDRAADTPTASEPASYVPAMSVGEIHTEFLQILYARFDMYWPNKVSTADKERIAHQVAKQLADKYGIKSLCMEEVLRYIECGRRMAKQDPVELVQSALNPEELIWWDRFSASAEIQNARTVYQDHCLRYGAPEDGTILANIIDISLSSAEFWADYHRDEEPKYKNPHIPPVQRGWGRRLLRFACVVAVDAVSGGLAGAGGGGVVGAGIVGGLASHGADEILFGD